MSLTIGIDALRAGLCGCGCGKPAPVASQTDRARGYVKGRPMRFLQGHGGHEKLRKDPDDLVVVEDRGHGTPCWIWQGGKTDGGYGRLSHGGRLHAAHRWFYEQARGPIPLELQLDHRCRVRLCCRPDHLEPVTGAENTRRSATAKLTAAQVAEIRAERDRLLAAADVRSPRRDGKPRVRTPRGERDRVAAKYGISSTQVKHIWAGRSWA